MVMDVRAEPFPTYALTCNAQVTLKCIFNIFVARAYDCVRKVDQKSGYFLIAQEATELIHHSSFTVMRLSYLSIGHEGKQKNLLYPFRSGG